MSVDERLSDWLEQTTPEPPHAVTVADIALRVQRRRRPWQPLLAAACVVLVAAITIVIATRATKHDAAPPAHRTSTRPRPTPTSPTPTTSTRVVAGLPIRPWNARIKRFWESGLELTSDGTSLFVTTFAGKRSTIYRLDARSGSPVDGFQPHGSIVGHVAFSDGEVWIAVFAKHSVHVEGLDPATLNGRTRLPAVRESPGDIVSLAAAGTRIYLAVGDRITAFDAATRSVEHIYDVKTPHRISGLAVRGTRLYAGTGAGEGSGDLLTYDTTSGELLNTVSDLGAVSAITATGGGLWVSTSSGMSAEVDFNGQPVQPGGGGIGPTVGVFGSTAWLGGTGVIQCADPNTGRVRARARLTFDNGKQQLFVTDLVAASGHVYAWASGDQGHYLVELHPPAACG